MSRDPADDNQNLPAWLRGVPLPPRPPGRDLPPASDAPESWSAAPTPPAPLPEDLPSWLKELGPAEDTGSLPQASASVPLPEDLPSWLKELGDSTDTETPPQASMPAWPEAASGPASPAPSGGDLPGWLADAGQESVPPRQAESDLPDWLRDAVTESPAQTPELREPPLSQADANLPDWLSGADAAPAEPPAAAEALPSWLAGLTADEPDAPSSMPATGPQPDAIPSWLNAAADAGSATPTDEPNARFWDDPSSLAGPPTPTDQNDSGADDSGIPAWLRDIPDDEIRKVMEGDDDEITVEPFSFGDPSDAPRAAPATDVPSWLSGISGESGGESGTGPSWLSGIPDASATDSDAAGVSDLPLWHQDRDSPLADAPSAAMPSGTDVPPVREPPADSVPSWLSDAEPAQPPADALPSWLQPVSAGPAKIEEAPSWLQIGDAPPAETSSGASSASADLPSWLNDAIGAAPPDLAPPVDSPPPRPITPAPSVAPADDLPAWLRDEAPVPASEKLPDWLRASSPAEAPPPEAARIPQPAADDLPPWLRDEAGKPLPTAGAPGDTNLPEWLRGSAPDGSSVPAPADSAPPAAPDWLHAEPPAPSAEPAPTSFDWFGEADSASAAGRPAAGENEFFGGAELPAWLRKTDPDPAAEISPADARSLDWLARLGAHEEESPGIAAAPAMKVPLPQPRVRTEAHVSSLALLQRLAANPYPVAEPLPAPAEPSFWRRFGLERLLYIVLLIALLAALAVPGFAAGLQAPPTAPGASELFQQIDALTDRDVVLIGYEWDARRTSELKPLEQAVIGQLIQKHVKLVLVSTDPQGTLLLFDLRDQLEAANYRGGGEDYILLGYKPGGELALRSLAQNFQQALRLDFQGSDATIGALAGGLQTGKPLTVLSDFAMILVLADDPSDVQSWVEQVYRSVPQRPLAFLLPAEVAPIVQPYLQPPRDPQRAPITHLAGKQGALAYEQLRGAEHTPSVQIEREIGQQRLSILVFIVLLLVGGGAVALGGALRRGGGA